MTLTLTGVAITALPSASQAAPAAPPLTAAASPVTAPGISAPPDVVVGAADGAVHLNVTLNAPGVNPVAVNYATANGTTSRRTRPARAPSTATSPSRNAHVQPG